MVPLDRSRRNDISPHPRAIILRARDSRSSNRDRLRYRTCTTSPRLPEQTTTPRAQHIPQLLWPQWTLLLKPPGIKDEWFRTAASAALLLPGNTTADITSATAILEPRNSLPRQGHNTFTNALNKAVKHSPSSSNLQTICVIANYLDQNPVPINYHRRRQLDLGELLTENAWHDITTVHHVNSRLRHQLVRAWLYSASLETASTTPRRRSRSPTATTGAKSTTFHVI